MIKAESRNRDHLMVRKDYSDVHEFDVEQGKG